MKYKMKHQVVSFFLVLISCLLCFCIQSGIYNWLRSQEARFVSPVSEENSLIRLQNVHNIDAPVLFLGSSLTERLLPRKECASVAMSHSSFVYVNEFMKTRFKYKKGTVYVLEVNNMFQGSNIELMNRTSRWDFNLWRESSIFSFAAKPTNLLVSLIFYAVEHKKSHTDATYEGGMTLVDMDKVPTITEHQLKEWAYLIDGVKELKSRGGRICFINHPCKVTPKFFTDNFAKGCILAKHLGIPVLNYNTKEWVEQLQFSDPTHLDSRKKSTVMYMNTAALNAEQVAVE